MCTGSVLTGGTEKREEAVDVARCEGCRHHPLLARCSAYRRGAYGGPTMTRALKGPGAVPHVCSRELVLSRKPPHRVLCSRRTIEARRFSDGTIACMNAWESSSFVPKYEMTLLLTSERPNRGIRQRLTASAHQWVRAASLHFCLFFNRRTDAEGP